jgi:hypothetical protein
MRARATAIRLSLALAGSLVAVACAKVSSGQPPPGGGAAGSGAGGGGQGGVAGSGSAGQGAAGTAGSAGPRDAGMDASTVGPLTDFPMTPFIDPSAPANAPALFDGTPPRAGGAPCIVSPIPGALMPRNWLRPRFELAAAAGDNLFEIDVTVAGFAHPLRIFTGQPNAVLDGALWDRLRKSIVDETIGVTARGLALAAGGAVQAGPSPAATSNFMIAPVDAPGKIVYWALADDMGTKVGSLKGFGIGEESVQNVLVPSQVGNRAANETCIGCHAATPDGFGVGFQMGPQSYFDDLADIRSGTVGTLPTYVSPAALATMRALHGIPTFSAAHWTDGDRIVLLNDTGTLHWVELSGGATGTLARTGDANRAVLPAFSHDGMKVVYVSTPSTLIDGRLDTGPADLTWIPYANRAGGAATPLPGASDPSATEYYPAFSPDDKLVAFTRLVGAGSAYSNPAAEIYVVPFNGGAGGKAVRLGANDAAACQTGLASPGLTNDWPKWSPRAVVGGDGRTYYWLTFSSKRAGTANAQLYVAGIFIDETGQMWNTPALYLWNQPAADGNHTPSWDDFSIPPIVIN